MKTDRELLELAAKAAGIVTSTDPDTDELLVRCKTGLLGHQANTFNRPWNPIIDDGDALRLAVKLRITPHIDASMTDCEDCTEAHLGDPYAATRRAIVRAAAAIGETL